MGHRMPEMLAIVGASARAASQSALRAGFTPRAADLFADLDLAACCSASRVERYPLGFARMLNRWPAGDWIYTGALENYPRLVDRLARSRNLLGNRGQALRCVRDPRQIASALARHGLPFPDIAFQTRVDPQQPWLIKRFRSAGGSGIGLWQSSDACSRLPSTCYLQRQVAGQPCAAVFVAAHNQAALLGLTRQLIGVRWAEADGFRYCGSVGPMKVENAVGTTLRRIGQVLVEAFGLRGLFGVDVVLDGERVWTIEVNPRYTASVEILERAASFQAIGMHVRACRENHLPEIVSAESRGAFGKIILHADDTVIVSEAFVSAMLASNENRIWPIAADIPAAGTQIERGRPIITLFGEGRDEAEVLEKLRRRVERTKPLLHGRNVEA